MTTEAPEDRDKRIRWEFQFGQPSLIELEGLPEDLRNELSLGNKASCWGLSLDTRRDQPGIAGDRIHWPEHHSSVNGADW
jgi:hypothetical protein